MLAPGTSSNKRGGIKHEEDAQDLFTYTCWNGSDDSLRRINYEIRRDKMITLTWFGWTNIAITVIALAALVYLDYKDNK